VCPRQLIRNDASLERDADALVGILLEGGSMPWLKAIRILPQDQLTWDYGHGTRQWDRLDKQQKKRLSLGTISLWHSRVKKYTILINHATCTLYTRPCAL
jgi:hypothetical protein